VGPGALLVQGAARHGQRCATVERQAIGSCRAAADEGLEGSCAGDEGIHRAGGHARAPVAGREPVGADGAGPHGEGRRQERGLGVAARNRARAAE
nr:hypothetical protein [Tanacetum cinerariifolium]